MLSLTRNLKLLAPALRVQARFAGGGELSEVGPWPRTKEERERAAKKYNLIPEDYEPYDEDDAFGDYPKLKAIGAYNRDKYDDYDDPTDMRFYGEVFHRDADLYYWERIDPLEHEKNNVPTAIKALVMFGGLASLASIIWLFRTFKIEINNPWKQRKYHPPDQKYYHFPTSSSDAHHPHH